LFIDINHGDAGPWQLVEHALGVAGAEVERGPRGQVGIRDDPSGVVAVLVHVCEQLAEVLAQHAGLQRLGGVWA
jgi:hypothetical protein